MLRYLRQLDAILKKATGEEDPAERWRMVLAILIVVVAGLYWLPQLVSKVVR